MNQSLKQTDIGSKKSLQYDCSTTVGNKRFTWYHPVEIGNFTIICWNSGGKLHPARDLYKPVIGVSLYEIGRVMRPNQDSRFKTKRWVKAAATSSLTLADVEEMIADIEAAEPKYAVDSYWTQEESPLQEQCFFEIDCV
tara:strand:+ start:515 stop:931 length:417 start_codon:yes stop_codon:yes gene_type:complete